MRANMSAYNTIYNHPQYMPPHAHIAHLLTSHHARAKKFSPHHSRGNSPSRLGVDEMVPVVLDAHVSLCLLRVCCASSSRIARWNSARRSSSSNARRQGVLAFASTRMDGCEPLAHRQRPLRSIWRMPPCCCCSSADITFETLRGGRGAVGVGLPLLDQMVPQPNPDRRRWMRAARPPTKQGLQGINDQPKQAKRKGSTQILEASDVGDLTEISSISCRRSREVGNGVRGDPHAPRAAR